MVLTSQMLRLMLVVAHQTQMLRRLSSRGLAKSVNMGNSSSQFKVVDVGSRRGQFKGVNMEMIMTWRARIWGVMMINGRM